MSGLPSWIRKRYLSVAPKTTRFALVHTAHGSLPATLETHVIKGGDIEAEIAEIIETFDDAATDHVRAFAKAQAYGIVAYADNDIVGQYTFRLRPPADAIDPGETEPATGAGALGQSMRHVEGLAKLHLDGIYRTMNNLMAENDALRRREQTRDDRELEVMKQLEVLISHRADRELVETREKNEQARKDRLIGKLETHILPPLLEHLSGGAGPFFRLIESLEPEQLRALLEFLRPDQKEAVLELLKRKAALEASLPPKLGAGGGGANGKPS